jgi:hypothetical protein
LVEERLVALVAEAASGKRTSQVSRESSAVVVPHLGVDGGVAAIRTVDETEQRATACPWLRIDTCPIKQRWSEIGKGDLSVDCRSLGDARPSHYQRYADRLLH